MNRVAEAAAATAAAPSSADRQKALAEAAEAQRKASTEQAQRLEEERKRVAESRAGASKVNAFKEAELKAKEEKERKLRAMMEKMGSKDGSSPDVWPGGTTCFCFHILTIESKNRWTKNVRRLLKKRDLLIKRLQKRKRRHWKKRY